MKQVKFNTKLAVALVASTALCGTAVLAASQATAPAKAPAAQATNQSNLMFKVSDHATTALGGITAARLALMQWSGDRAKTILTQVKTTLGNAQNGLTKATLVKYGGKKASGDSLLNDSMYYPVGITTDTVTGFTMAPVQKSSAASAATSAETTDQVKAELKISKNPTDQMAPQELIDTSVTMALLPRDATIHAIDTAIKQIDKGDFAAADLALSGISQSIVYGSMTQQASQPVSS